VAFGVFFFLFAIPSRTGVGRWLQRVLHLEAFLMLYAVLGIQWVGGPRSLLVSLWRMCKVKTQQAIPHESDDNEKKDRLQD
jgi:hypothetical protein